MSSSHCFGHISWALSEHASFYLMRQRQLKSKLTSRVTHEDKFQGHGYTQHQPHVVHICVASTLSHCSVLLKLVSWGPPWDRLWDLSASADDYPLPRQATELMSGTLHQPGFPHMVLDSPSVFSLNVFSSFNTSIKATIAQDVILGQLVFATHSA